MKIIQNLWEYRTNSETKATKPETKNAGIKDTGQCLDSIRLFDISVGTFCSILVRCCTRIGIMSVLRLPPVADATAARNTQSEASLDRNGMTVASMKHPVTISTAYQAKMRPQNHSAASFLLCYWSIPLLPLIFLSHSSFTSRAISFAAASDWGRIPRASKKPWHTPQ